MCKINLLPKAPFLLFSIFYFGPSSFTVLHLVSDFQNLKAWNRNTEENSKLYVQSLRIPTIHIQDFNYREVTSTYRIWLPTHGVIIIQCIDDTASFCVTMPPRVSKHFSRIADELPALVNHQQSKIEIQTDNSTV